MIQTLLTLAIGFIIGLVVQFRKDRVQCTNCGKHNTHLVAAGYGGEGGECGFAVKHSEQHVCRDCDKTTYVKMKLIK